MNKQIMITEININQKEKPILDPQLKNQLMKDLSPEDLSRIKKGFDLYKGKVSIKQFVIILLDSLFQTNDIKNHTKQILTFIQLYILIDLKNIGKIKFEDFTNYLIQRQKQDGETQSCHFSQNQQLSQLQLMAEKVFPLTNSSMIGLLESNKKSVLLLQKKTYKATQNISFGGIIINYVAYIPNFNIFCISTNDKFINFYQPSQNTLIRRFLLPDTIFFIITHNDHGPNPKIIMGSTNGHLYQFSLKKILAIMNKKNKQAQKQEENRKKMFSPHQIYKAFIINKIVTEQPDLTCFDILSDLQLFVTGSNDSKVRLYQMRQNGLQILKELDGHYKGVKGVTVSIHHKVIVSCSFDFDLLVWNAYLQHPVARLQGHQAPLVNVCCPKKDQIIISMDSKSVMKIWNSQNYQLIQNLIIYQNFPTNTSINFFYKQQTNLAIVYTKKIKFYEYVVSFNPKVTDDYPNFPVRYSSKNLQIYIGSKTNIKVWSIEKGIQVRLYNNVIQSDISIIQLDNRQRRLFVGSIQGHIVAVDIFSGLTIANYSSHEMEISLLVYNQINQLLISGSWQKKVKIHNDTNHLDKIQSRQNVLRNINNVSEKDLAGGSYSLAEMIIATHSKNVVCRLWDFQKGFLQAQFILPNDIVLTSFLSPLPLLIIADSKGSIYIFSTKLYIQKPFSLLTQWKNMYSIQKSSQITYISYRSNQNYSKHQIILGDQYGYMRIIDLTTFINQNEIKPITPELLGNKNPYRIQDYNYIGTTQLSSNIHDFSSFQSKTIVPPQSIKQTLQIKAHNQRISYIELVNQSSQPLLLSVGGDQLVKIWNYQGQIRGILKQGAIQNIGWQYKKDKKWKNKEICQYEKIKQDLQNTFEQFHMKKRLAIIPFTQQEKFTEVDNNQIYKDLRQVDGYLQKAYGQVKKSGRLY